MVKTNTTQKLKDTNTFVLQFKFQYSAPFHLIMIITLVTAVIINNRLTLKFLNFSSNIIN